VAPHSKKQSDINSVPPGSQDKYLTTNQGLRISDNHNSLKAGPRGPSLLEDFVLREKITHFDHERIPERIVHARGAGAFGYFECTEDMSKFTNAGFLTKKGKRTPVLTRFSTVAGSRGSMDTARDVRGFSVKFYTDEGNYDFVGNNIPVFFIQDAMKFPDLIHAVKPEPNNEMPQAASAHDTFWDFISLMPESMHMIMWVMSDRAIPRSYRMMEGFGVHTFRFVNEAGEATFVKFHWKPRLGVHSLTWEESMNLGGQDPDFHRRDLFEAIDKGAFPEWDFGVQLIPEKDEHLYPFDLLDPTKLVPEEMVPVKIMGKMVLNRNPDNYFAEIEQAAFHPGHLVPGIDVSNDPLLQGRLFSYTDTQLKRLGGPNFHEIPVNRPLAPVNNNQRDGMARQHIAVGRVAYEPNSLADGPKQPNVSMGGGCPFHAGADLKTFVHYAEKMDAHKVRARSESFNDHFSQAKLFFDSQDAVEQSHIINALSFELSKVETLAIRERMICLLARTDMKLAKAVADHVGVEFPDEMPIPPNAADPENNIVPENRATEIAIKDDEANADARGKKKLPKSSAALSMMKNLNPSAKTRKVAILIGAGTDAAEVARAKKSIEAEGASAELIAETLQTVSTKKGQLNPDKTFDNTTSLMYDGVILPPGSDFATNGKAKRFALQAFKHCKTLGAFGDQKKIFEAWLSESGLTYKGAWPGLVMEKDSKTSLKPFLDSMSKHRIWSRENHVKNLSV
jgi:catalase